jgi:hypothetical protein
MAGLAHVRAGLLEAFWLQSQNGVTACPVVRLSPLSPLSPLSRFRRAGASLPAMKDQRAAKQYSGNR